MAVTTAAKALEFQACAFPEKPAIYTKGEVLTYRQWHAAANALANSLDRSGIARGSQIAFLGTNGPEPAIAYGAACLLGCTLVLLPADRPDSLLARLVESLPAAAVLLGRTNRRKHYTPAHANFLGSGVRPVLTVSCYCADSSPGSRLPLRADPHQEPHIILFTGGTTSIPKGVIFNEQKFMLATALAVERLGIIAQDVLINPYPAHHYGGIQAICQTLIAGATLVQLPVPSPRLLLDAIATHRGTFVVAVPTLWRRVLAFPGQAGYCLSSLRMANAASDRVPSDLVEAIRQRTGAISIQGYGLTETGMVTLVPAADHLRKSGSCGVPDSVSSIRITNASGSALQPGHVGEVWIQSEHAMDGYFGQPELTRAVFDRGWFRTGDLGYVDKEGYLYIVGRKKDTISCGAEKIEPEELETLLSSFPGVEIAIVAGIPDPDMGHIPAAAVVTRPGSGVTAEQLIEHSTRTLGSARRLRYVAFLKSVPLTPLGKPDRTRAAEMLRSGMSRGLNRLSAQDEFWTAPS